MIGQIKKCRLGRLKCRLGRFGVEILKKNIYYANIKKTD